MDEWERYYEIMRWFNLDGHNHILDVTLSSDRGNTDFKGAVPRDKAIADAQRLFHDLCEAIRGSNASYFDCLEVQPESLPIPSSPVGLIRWKNLSGTPSLTIVNVEYRDPNSESKGYIAVARLSFGLPEFSTDGLSENLDILLSRFVCVDRILLDGSSKYAYLSYRRPSQIGYLDGAVTNRDVLKMFGVPTEPRFYV